MAIAFFDIGQLYDNEGGIKPASDLPSFVNVEIGENGEIKSVRVRPADKLKALELLGRHLGMFNDKLQLESEAKPQVIFYWPENGRDPIQTKEQN